METDIQLESQQETDSMQPPEIDQCDWDPEKHSIYKIFKKV